MSSIVSLDASVFDGPLEGRTLMLNTEKAARFQCYGFAVMRNCPIQIVPKHAQEGPLRSALAQGVLLDVTNREDATGATAKVIQDIDRAVKAGTLTSVTEGEEVATRVMVGHDARGNSYVIIPKDDADFERMQAELKETGYLRVEKPKTISAQFSGLSPIYEEELPLDRGAPGE